MHCCHHSWIHKIAETIGSNGSELFLSVFAISLFGSFIHCIGMCGPIASARYSLKLMKADLTEHKFKGAIDYSYYIGKGISYIVIMTLLYFVSFKLKENEVSKYIIFAALLSLSFVFALIAIDFSKANKLTRGFANHKFIAKYSKNFDLISGFILGFIPCGYLYTVLVMIALKSDYYINALLATCLFALGTVPGLVLVAFCGNRILYRYKRVFSIFFKGSMLLNAFLIARYALKLL